MNQEERNLLAVAISQGKFRVEDMTEAEQVEAFGSVLVKVDHLQKGEAAGHEFRDNQYTSGKTGTAREQRGELFQEEDQDGKKVKLKNKSTGEGELVSVREARKKLFDVEAQDEESPFELEPSSAQEQALGMTEAEFNYLDSKGLIQPWGPSKEGQAELARLRSTKDMVPYHTQKHEDRRAKIQLQDPTKSVEQILEDKVKAFRASRSHTVDQVDPRKEKPISPFKRKLPRPKSYKP